MLYIYKHIIIIIIIPHLENLVPSCTGMLYLYKHIIIIIIPYLENFVPNCTGMLYPYRHTVPWKRRTELYQYAVPLPAYRTAKTSYRPLQE